MRRAASDSALVVANHIFNTEWFILALHDCCHKRGKNRRQHLKTFLKRVYSTTTCSAIPLLQHSFLFTLYLLKKFGNEWRTTAFYQDCFLKTFPTLLLEIKPVEHFFTPEDVLRYTYSVRCLERFAHFFGLIEVERDCWLKSLPLIDQVVQFSFENR